MKSATFFLASVRDSGAIEMSACPVATIGTFVSWLTGTVSSLTPSRLAYSLARYHADPSNGSPEPEVFSFSQGNSPRTATRRVPLDLISSMRLLVPGAGGSVPAAWTGSTARPNASPRAIAVARTPNLSILLSLGGLSGPFPRAGHASKTHTCIQLRFRAGTIQVAD